MAYSKTSAPGPLPPQGTDPPRDHANGRETAPDACESGYPAHVPPELRPARGVLVGLAFMTVLSVVAVVIERVIT